MQDWSLDVINAYCEKHFHGDFLCEMSDGKGRVMIAQKDVEQGELLFIEPPLHIVQEDEENAAFWTLKDLCAQGGDSFDYEPLWYWCALSSLTDEQLNGGPKIGSLESVTADQHRQLLSLYHEPVEEPSDAVVAICEALGLEVQPLIVEELLQAWILNCFEHSEDPLGYSAYFASSFISHSCGPNAAWVEDDDGGHMLRAREPIEKGDEITISYLEEHVLLHSAQARKHFLQETKLFECGCHRCAPPYGSDDIGEDTCRGFVCRKCGECGVFHRLTKGPKGQGKGKGKGQGLNGVFCKLCGAAVEQKESRRLLQAEAMLQEKLKKLDEELETTSISVAMTSQRKESLIKGISEGVGPQNWLCDRIWEHLQSWYAATGRRQEQREMLALRVEYQTKAYVGMSATLAWTLESHADTFLRHGGFGSKTLDSDRASEEEMLSQVLPTFEESMRMLGLMYGKDHEHYKAVEKKYLVAQKFLAKRAATGPAVSS